tara:strand:- start:772 stop:2184 length:1413 start_codon:yes stop_codon:yes gene_type:complete
MSRNRITSEDALLINQIATGIKNGDDVRDMLSQITDMTKSKRDRVLKSLGDELNRLDVTQRRLKLESKTPGEKFFVDMPTKGPMRELQALKRTSAVQLRKDPESGKIRMVPAGTLMVEPEGKIGMYIPGIQPGTEMSEVEGAIAELKARGEYKPIYDTEPMLLAAAINDMYEGPDLPYKQQVSQAVRSAGLPRATMPGMRPVSLMERNLELERMERNSDFYRKENPMMGPPDPTPMQMRKMAEPVDSSPPASKDMGFMDRTQARMDSIQDGFQVGYEPVAKDMGYQPTQKTSESGTPLYERSKLADILNFASVPTTALAESDIGFDTPIGPAGTPEYMRRELNLPKTPSESGPQSATLAELRSQKAYDRGFRRFLQDREQYQSSQRPSIAEEEEFFKGGSMLAESARQRAIKDRDTASIEALGFAEGQEFAERETQSTVDRALRGGLRMEPTREDIAFMESVEETPPEML